MTVASPIFMPCSALPYGKRRGGFTLIEIMVAAIAASIILVAIYGIFYRALKMRDGATQHIRDARLRARAVNVIRNDLKNALVSGGILASTLQGDTNSNSTDGTDVAAPGYLKFTTTTGKDTADEMYGDVQQVEYYIARDQANSGAPNTGNLMRMVTRDLLDSSQTVVHEELLLSGVQSLQVSFYDGAQWQQSWQVSGTSTTSGTGTAVAATTTAASSTTSGSYAQTLPAAIRVDIQQAAPPPPPNASMIQMQQNVVPAPMEILVPWVTAPFLSGTNYIIGTGTTTTPLPQQ